MKTEQDDRVEKNHVLRKVGFCVNFISDKNNDGEGTWKVTRIPYLF